jgi:hypothetical protein
MFHTLSEEEVMFPEAVRLSSSSSNNSNSSIAAAGGGSGAAGQSGTVAAACNTCHEEHCSEVMLFEELGRLLADVRAHVRRGRTRDVTGMLGKLVDTAKRACGAISAHMQREEAEVLPLLAAALGPAEQRAMVWHTLRWVGGRRGGAGLSAALVLEARRGRGWGWGHRVEWSSPSHRCCHCCLLPLQGHAAAPAGACAAVAGE